MRTALNSGVPTNNVNHPSSLSTQQPTLHFSNPPATHINHPMNQHTVVGHSRFKSFDLKPTQHKQPSVTKLTAQKQIAVPQATQPTSSPKFISSRQHEKPFVNSGRQNQFNRVIRLADFEEVKGVQQKGQHGLGSKEGGMRPKTSGNAAGLVKKRTFEYSNGVAAGTHAVNFKVTKDAQDWIADEEYSIFNHPQVFGTSDSDNKQSPPRSLKKPKIGEQSHKVSPSEKYQMSSTIKDEGPINLQVFQSPDNHKQYIGTSKEMGKATNPSAKALIKIEDLQKLRQLIEQLQDSKLFDGSVDSKNNMVQIKLTSSSGIFRAYRGRETSTYYEETSKAGSGEGSRNMLVGPNKQTTQEIASSCFFTSSDDIHTPIDTHKGNNLLSQLHHQLQHVESMLPDTSKKSNVTPPNDLLKLGTPKQLEMHEVLDNSLAWGKGFTDTSNGIEDQSQLSLKDVDLGIPSSIIRLQECSRLQDHLNTSLVQPLVGEIQPFSPSFVDTPSHRNLIVKSQLSNSSDQPSQHILTVRQTEKPTLEVAREANSSDQKIIKTVQSPANHQQEFNQDIQFSSQRRKQNRNHATISLGAQLPLSLTSQKSKSRQINNDLKNTQERLELSEPPMLPDHQSQAISQFNSERQPSPPVKSPRTLNHASPFLDDSAVDEQPPVPHYLQSLIESTSLDTNRNQFNLPLPANNPSRQSILLKSSNNKGSLQELMKLEMRAFEQESCTDTLLNVQAQPNIEETRNRYKMKIDALRPDEEDEIYMSINYNNQCGMAKLEGLAQRGRLAGQAIGQNKSQGMVVFGKAEMEFREFLQRQQSLKEISKENSSDQITEFDIKEETISQPELQNHNQGSALVSSNLINNPGYYTETIQQNEEEDNELSSASLTSRLQTIQELDHQEETSKSISIIDKVRSFGSQSNIEMSTSNQLISHNQKAADRSYEDATQQYNDCSLIPDEIPISPITSPPAIDISSGSHSQILQFQNSPIFNAKYNHDEACQLETPYLCEQNMENELSKTREAIPLTTDTEETLIQPKVDIQVILQQSEVTSRSNRPMLEMLHTFAKGSKEQISPDILLLAPSLTSPSLENAQANSSAQNTSNSQPQFNLNFATNFGAPPTTSDYVRQIRNNRHDFIADSQQQLSFKNLQVQDQHLQHLFSAAKPTQSEDKPSTAVLTSPPPPFTLNLAKRINQELIKRRLPLGNTIATGLPSQRSTSRETNRKNPVEVRKSEITVAKKTQSLFAKRQQITPATATASPSKGKSKERVVISPKKMEAILIDISKQQDKGSRTKRTQSSLNKNQSPNNAKARLMSNSQKELSKYGSQTNVQASQERIQCQYKSVCEFVRPKPSESKEKVQKVQTSLNTTSLAVSARSSVNSRVTQQDNKQKDNRLVLSKVCGLFKKINPLPSARLGGQKSSQSSLPTSPIRPTVTPRSTSRPSLLKNYQTSISHASLHSLGKDVSTIVAQTETSEILSSNNVSRLFRKQQPQSATNNIITQQVLHQQKRDEGRLQSIMTPLATSRSQAQSSATRIMQNNQAKMKQQ